LEPDAGSDIPTEFDNATGHPAARCPRGDLVQPALIWLTPSSTACCSTCHSRWRYGQLLAASKMLSACRGISR
jgi:hypothetical protein